MKKSIAVFLVAVVLLGACGQPSNIDVNNNVPSADTVKDSEVEKQEDKDIKDVSKEEEKSKEDLDGVLQAVLDSKKIFVTENGSAVYLNEYKLFNGAVDISKVEYTPLDFDGDGKQELVLLLHSNIDGAYLVLHYNGYDVYGYEFVYRAMQSLKQDGSFVQSGGAGCHHYSRLAFDDKEYKLINDAIKDSTGGVFELHGEAVAIEDLNEYINDWNLKENVVWKELEWVVSETPSSDNETGSEEIIENEPVESNPEPEYTNGVIYTEETEEGCKVFVVHEKGQYSFTLPKNAVDVTLTEKKLTFALQNEFSRVEYTYEVVEGINSAPEAELKVKEITDKLPYSLSDMYSAIYVIRDMEDMFSSGYDFYFSDRNLNVDDIWYDEVNANGVAYFYESSSHTNKDDLIYDCMMAEAYTYYGGVAWHEVIEVIECNYMEYYNSLETRIEKNAISNKLMQCIKCPFSGKGINDVFYGFENCLWKKAVVKTK